MYGNGKLTETEERYFLRKLRNSYEISADKLNSYVLMKRNTDIRLRMNGNVMLKTRHNTNGVTYGNLLLPTVLVFPVAASRLWNALPQNVTSASSMSVFRKRLKAHLFSHSPPPPISCSACEVTLSLQTI